jgi:hypothetical protein
LRWETYEQASEAIGKEVQEILDNQVRKIEEGGSSKARPLENRLAL